MALQGTFPDVRTPARRRSGVVAPNVDRDRSFRQARRHTLTVRLLKFALPLASLATIATYGAGMQLSLKLNVGSGKLDTGKITVSTENLTMSNPRYEGFNKDGSKFVVTAGTATQDIRQQQGPIALTTIDGRMQQANNNVVTVTAPRGSFDNTANRLELMDEIKVRSGDGMRADLTQATIFMKENRIVTTQPVAIDMSAGQIRANEMDMRQGDKQVVFGNGVMTRLKPEARAATAGPKAPATAGGVAGPRMIGATDGPVDVSSNTLTVDDAKKTAVFVGSVIAKQGEATLRTPEMQATYDGTPLASPGAGAAAATAQPPVAGKLKKLVVPHDVTMTQGADHITSDSAEFDVEHETGVLVGKVSMASGSDRKATTDRAELDSKNDTVMLIGNVEVQQEKNVLRGARLSVDRKAGVTKLWTPALTAGQHAGRISARFTQAAAPPGKATAKAAAAASGTDASGVVFRTDPNAPIDIDAETLDVLDKAKTATFRGAVHVVQGGFVIRSAELVASYAGETGLGAVGTGNDAKQPAAQLTRVRVNQKVEITSTDGQTATAEAGDFDVKANTMTLTGNVVLKKGSSVVLTPKAIIDMTTGFTYFEKQWKAVGPAIATPNEVRAPYTLPNLPEKKEVGPSTPPAFATDPTACRKGATCVVFDPKDSGDKKGGEKAASPWQTTPAGSAPAPKQVPAKPAKAPEASGWSSSAPAN